MRSTQAGERPRDIDESEAKERSVETVLMVVHDAFGQYDKHHPAVNDKFEAKQNDSKGAENHGMTKGYQAAAGGNGMPKARGNENEPPTDPGERGG
eukprot:9198286-Alexandrium_andersonii.AAC.1